MRALQGDQIGELEETPGLSASAWQMWPLSRGYVEAKSNQPGDAPTIAIAEGRAEGLTKEMGLYTSE